MTSQQDSQETLPPKASETASEATLPPSGERTIQAAGQSSRMFAGYELLREIARGGMGVVGGGASGSFSVAGVATATVLAEDSALWAVGALGMRVGLGSRRAACS